MALSLVTDPRFTVNALSSAINAFDRQYGFLGELNLFGPVTNKLTTTFVQIAKINGSLALIPAQSRTGETNKHGTPKTQKITIEVPHLPLDDFLNADDIANLETALLAGDDVVVASFVQIVGQKLMAMSRKHDITHEYYRAQALNGYVKDADGSILVDLFALFGVTRANNQHDLDLGAAAPGIISKLSEINDSIEDGISDDTIGTIWNGFEVTSGCIASPTFFRKLINNAEVKDAYQLQVGNAVNNPRTQDLRQRGFVYGGTVFFNYNAKVASTDFVTAGTGLVFPLGTNDTFEEHSAPGNYMETVNQIAEDMYSKIVPTRNEKGADIETQSNRLALCKRPQTLHQITDQ